MACPNTDDFIHEWSYLFFILEIKFIKYIDLELTPSDRLDLSKEQFIKVGRK
jgi:hypothetical protein